MTPWTIAHQAPLCMGFSRQEYWSGLPCPPPGDLPYPGIKPVSLRSPALAGGFFTTSATCDPKSVIKVPPAPATLAVEVSPFHTAPPWHWAVGTHALLTMSCDFHLHWPAAEEPPPALRRGSPWYSPSWTDQGSQDKNRNF